jgi:hypothetical protein
MAPMTTKFGNVVRVATSGRLVFIVELRRQPSNE